MRFMSFMIILMFLAGCSSSGETGNAGQAIPTDNPASVEQASPSPSASPAVSTSPSVEAVTTGNAPIEEQYPGFVHKDSFELNGQTYEVYYWNSGDFDYTQFVVARNRELLFDSKQKGLSFEGGVKLDQTKSIWAKALIQNGRPTLLFSLADNRPESATIVLEEIEGKLQVTVNDEVLLTYEDVDQDGELELLASPYSGQVPLGPALFAVYEFRDNQYIPNRARTQQYYENQLVIEEQHYKAEPEESTFESLMDVYLILDRLDEAEAKFPEYYKWAGQTAGDGGFVSVYHKLIEAGSYDPVKGWMDKLKPLDHTSLHQ
ncbi:hypothetical protein [Paenibacillus sp. P46E]|uniref:hypothetical protein n=1 Tax=Paenibacillus sp. P46E TaxID=1349436 RepID=UPI00093D40FE|nr:hypothetical protein [Paenibacillus sp. P46E]OKP95918.1 hypothetical protein A3849_23510 [Paenibacillus sp. P46E]